MYQFSLERYKGLFSATIESIDKDGSGSENHQEKMDRITDQLKKDVYQYYATSLFSKDRLLLALSMSIAIKKNEGNFDQAEYDFFLRGGLILDKSEMPKNPAPRWLKDSSWEDIVDLS
jgi:dynein heavy chain